MKKTIKYIISITFIISAFLGIVHYCCFNENFYDKEHSKIMLYGKHINEHIGISNEELKELTHFTLEYLNDYDLSLDKEMSIKGQIREVFTEDEKTHMIDVRKLNINSVYICIIAFIIFVLCSIIFIIKYKDFNDLYLIYKKVLINCLIFITFLAIWAIFDFDSFWTLFHHIFFAGNDLWLLDLRTDILIMIVPPEFFNDLVIRIIELFIVAIVLFGLALKLLRRKQND